MFHVAICDDNSVFLSDFKNNVGSVLRNQNMAFEIDCFYNVSDFIQETTNGTKYQLLFLDIEFPNAADGINGADYVRNYLYESNTHIVFISGHPKHAIRLFDFQPLQFLIKPINQDKLVTTIKKSIDLWNCNNSTFHFVSNRQDVVIKIYHILYIESYGRRKILHSSTGKTYTFNDTFSTVFKQLEQYDFFSPHKSYIVNYPKVAVWQKEAIIMENGDIIPIGRTQQKKVQEIQFSHHLY